MLFAATWTALWQVLQFMGCFCPCLGTSRSKKQLLFTTPSAIFQDLLLRSNLNFLRRKWRLAKILWRPLKELDRFMDLLDGWNMKVARCVDCQRKFRWETSELRSFKNAITARLSNSSVTAQLSNSSVTAHLSNSSVTAHLSNSSVTAQLSNRFSSVE